MRKRSSISIILALTLCGGFVGAIDVAAQITPPAAPGSDTGVSGAIEQKLILSQAQRTAIYDQVSKDKSKVAPKDFSPVIGADVPPMIELYALPDDAVAGVPAAKLYKYTMVENKVVLVDPTRMRIVDVIAAIALIAFRAESLFATIFASHHLERDCFNLNRLSL